MSKKSKIEERVDSRLEQLRLELKQITMQTMDYQAKLALVNSKIILLEELLIK